MKYLPEIEFSSANEIGTLQFQKLTALIRYLSAHSPFYQDHFRQHNIKIESIRSLEDLSCIPVTTKENVQASNWDFLCVPKAKIVEYTSTSGTLGKPVTIALTANDIARLAYNEAISFACADGQSSDLYQLMLTLDRQFMAGLAYYEGIRKLGAGLVRAGPGLPAMQWEITGRLKPTAIVAVPSFVVRLLGYADENSIDYRSSSIQKIVCIGESIRHPDFRPNIMAQRITDAWNVKLYGTYAATEMQTAFTECSFGTGGHSHPELLIVEVLDENNVQVTNGKSGEITITTLGVEGMPLLRYKTGDIAELHAEKCACGRTTARIGPVLGRKQQMLKVKGTTIYPQAIFEILNHQPEIHDYVVEVFIGELGTDELRIYITIRDPGNGFTSGLSDRFQSVLKLIPDVVLVDKGELERLNRSQSDRKIRRFIDSRKTFF